MTNHTPFCAIADLREIGTVLNGASRQVWPSVLVLREAVCRVDRAASSIEMDANALLAENARLREALSAIIDANRTRRAFEMPPSPETIVDESR